MSLEVDIEKKFKGFHLQSQFTAGDETMGLLGASGCGKSLTMRSIAGIERPGGALDFAADEPVTFEQLATILGRLGAAPGEIGAAGADLSAFVDGADASGWAAPYLEWAADKGLVEGYDEPAGKRLAPGENASRERAATVLMRAFYLGVLR